MSLPNFKKFLIFLILGLTACGSDESAGPQLPDTSEISIAPHSSKTEDLLAATDVQAVINQYCVVCHNEALATAGLNLADVDIENVSANPAVLEKIVSKLRAGTMPPLGMPAPPDSDRFAMIGWLENNLDKFAVENPNPGRTDTLRLLNRTEYENAIRDLLALEIDGAALLPPDESGHGFDNVNVGDLPPALLDRYISAAQKISKLAVGATQSSVESEVINVPPDLTQEGHIAGLPIGTRGGTAFTYTFSRDGKYDIQVRLARNRTGNIGGLRNSRAQPLELLVDREVVTTFMVVPPEGIDHSQVDKNFISRVPITAGPHKIGVTFPKISNSLIESERQPLEARFNETRHPRQNPAVFQVTITGPFESKSAGDTPSRKQIFSCRPEATSEELACAHEIIATIARRAYRRVITEEDIFTPLAHFEEARKKLNFDEAIGNSISAILMNPNFLFRVELPPENLKGGEIYSISDEQLASRLSFFLWSSIPDNELLRLAEERKLSDPDILRAQVFRMLSDKRSENLSKNFAGQWLQLRNLEAFNPNIRD